ncbi:XkdQ/YqbQ family protein [Bacillus infantis]|uniref:XkdQ/YqbQ family protein n=1 Tax=Bacillus infantis TaxID=324767 RepID=UPI003CECE6D4
MMVHQLYVNGSNITDLVGDLSWSDNIDALGAKLEFNLAYSDMPKFPKKVVSIGDAVTLKNGKVLFQGIVISESTSGRSPKKYICFDYAFYLNKSKTIIQFNKHAASEAIQKVLTEYSIPNQIVGIPTRISKIYKEDVISDIIKDILEQATNETGTKYRLEMRAGVLHIERQRDLMINARINLIGNPSRTQSIEEMKNSILIVSEGEKVSKIVAEAKNAGNIKKYGLLQEIQTVDKKDMAKAKNIASQLLKELNVIREENSLELLGNDDVRSGRILRINEPVTGIVGDYLITDCTHSFSNGIHRMSLSLGVA